MNINGNLYLRHHHSSFTMERHHWTVIQYTRSGFRAYYLLMCAYEIHTHTRTHAKASNSTYPRFYTSPTMRFHLCTLHRWLVCICILNEWLGTQTTWELYRLCVWSHCMHKFNIKKKKEATENATETSSNWKWNYLHSYSFDMHSVSARMHHS